MQNQIGKKHAQIQSISIRVFCYNCIIILERLYNTDAYDHLDGKNKKGLEKVVCLVLFRHVIPIAVLRDQTIINASKEVRVHMFCLCES